MDRRVAQAGNPPVSTERRRRAKDAVAAAWRSAGWSHRPRRGVNYQPLCHCLCEYLEASFPGAFSPSEVSETVEKTLQAFMAPLHAGRVLASELSYQGLLGELDDQALERFRSSGQPLDDHPFGVTPSTVAEDEELTRALFGADASAVRTALRQLADEGEAVNFLIVSQYLDLGQQWPGRAPKATHVVMEFKDHELLVGVRITEQLVRQALQDFRIRLRRSA